MSLDTPTPTPTPKLLFPEFLQAVRGKDFIPPKYLIALDPGETTGVTEFRDGILTAFYQLKTKTVRDFTICLLNELLVLDETIPDMIVYEDYRIYSWKSEHHAWAALHTPQAIGALKAIATDRDIPLYTQLAQQPKAFCTDEKLKMWGYYHPSLKHARDAIRHATYYLLHNYKPGDPKHFNGNP